MPRWRRMEVGRNLCALLNVVGGNDRKETLKGDEGTDVSGGGKL